MSKGRFTTDDPWCAEMHQKAQGLRQAFVLRQYDHVGFHANQLLSEFIATRGKEVSENDINGVGSGFHPTPITDPSAINVYQSRPLDLFQLFPQRGVNTSRHLNHRSHPLTDDHPAIVCVGYVIAAIQNLGYRPTSPKADPAALAKYKADISSLNQSQIQAYTTYHICSFLTEVYGTWVNVSPSILLQCLQYFLPVSPLTAYLLCTHLLNAVIHDVPEPTDKERLINYTKGQKWKVPVVLKNLRYRRQLFVYLIQSIAIAVRLRFHVLYAPIAFPFEIIEQPGGVTLSADDKFRRSFIDVFVDIAKRQADLLLASMDQYTLTDENLYNTASEKSAMYPYIPTHIQQHLGSIFNAVDHHQSPFDFSSYEPYQITRLFITGNVTLNPTELASTTSAVLLTRPLPEKSELDPQDPNYQYVSTKLKELGRWDEPEEEVDSDSEEDQDIDAEDATTKAILEAFERMTKMNVEIVQDGSTDEQQQQSSDYAEKLLEQFGTSLNDELQQKTTASTTTTTTTTTTTITTPTPATHTSPIITTIEETTPSTVSEQSGSSGLFAVGPIVAITVGLLARHRWIGALFFKQIIRIPGVKGLIKVFKMVLKALYGV